MIEDEIWSRKEPDSPCIRVCVLHPEAKICMGCYRTSDEIAAWIRMDPEERLKLKAELPARAAQIKPQRRKRR